MYAQGSTHQGGPDHCLQQQVTSNPCSTPARGHTQPPQNKAGLYALTHSDPRHTAGCKSKVQRSSRLRAHPWPKQRCTPVHTCVRAGNISGKECVYREKHSPSLCPTSRPLLRLRVYENHRIKGQAIGQRSRASLKLLHDPYLAVAGVGAVLLKPRKDVPEGKRTERISVMGRYGTARRLLLGPL